MKDAKNGDAERLFFVQEIEPEVEVKLSATRRLTIRNNEKIAKGIHPATSRPLVTDGRICNDCLNLHRYQYHNGTYIKCSRHRLGESHSAASDVRASWPACIYIDELAVD
jgi:hypothetical protein